jgi:hypothetical protein
MVTEYGSKSSGSSSYVSKVAPNPCQNSEAVKKVKHKKKGDRKKKEEGDGEEEEGGRRQRDKTIINHFGYNFGDRLTVRNTGVMIFDGYMEI